MRTFIKTIFQYSRVLFLIAYLSLLIIHFFIKDSHPSNISVVYYASPLLLIMILGFFLTLIFIRRKPFFYGLAILFVIISCHFAIHYYGSPMEKSADKPTSKILFWNVATLNPLPLDILISHIKESQPEIIALVEAKDVSSDDLHILEIACPEYQFKILQGEMLVGSKKALGSFSYKTVVDVYRYNVMELRGPDKILSLMIADVYAYPYRNKEVALNTILEATKKYDVDILVGDFNTPYESVFFEDFKIGFESFHAYSDGLTYTWPLPFPVIEIDQIWMGPSLQPIELKKYNHHQSDHKLLIGEYY